jgi:ubiquinone/menaquinone biosynthesis C-methylase UbiE
MELSEEYVSNPEYETYYATLSNLRRRIIASLPLRSGLHVLDLGTGEGFFAIEAARWCRNIHITGIDISQPAIRHARKNLKRENLQDRVAIMEMDATKMSFVDGEFDMAINFTGLEDIHMTRGREGVQQTFLEVSRVLRPESHFSIAVMPPEEMETEAQRIEVALFSYICDATWLSLQEYCEMLAQSNFSIIRREVYYTGKKLTPEQAKAEIRFACKNDPKIYGVETPSFDEIWAEFGAAIEDHGLGHYSKVVSILARKTGETL